MREWRRLTLMWVATMVVLVILVVTSRHPRTEREQCLDSSSTNWRCDVDMTSVPSADDAGVISFHRETREYCRCMKGW